jgi:hypothetical protein
LRILPDEVKSQKSVRVRGCVELNYTHESQGNSWELSIWTSTGYKPAGTIFSETGYVYKQVSESGGVYSIEVGINRMCPSQMRGDV